MARTSKKPQLLERCNELGITCNSRMTVTQLEELIEEAEKYLVEPVSVSEDSMTPFEYFQYIKERINQMDDDSLTKMYNSSLKLMEKYKTFGQEKAEKKLAFHMKTILHEYDLLQLGINRFVYKSDIENYIDNISNKPVKIIEMKNYPREIPDEMIDIVNQTKDIFDEFYVLFTDYTGETFKEVEKERDPILFGGFCSKDRSLIADRFYYLGDWIDEYCDLTLDKLIAETSKDIVKEVEIPKYHEDLVAQLSSYEEKDDRLVFHTPKKKSFLNRIKSFKFGKK